jgi:hypothetical protein
MRHAMLSLALVPALLVGSCQGTEPDAAPPPVVAETTTERAAEIDGRDQYALAQAIAAARASHDRMEAALGQTRSEWIGRRYRWEMAFMPALCGDTGPCVALPFDHHKDPAHPIRQGWLPRLDLPQAQRQALHDACQGRARCVVELTGRLGQLELSLEQPVSMTLSEVEIHGVRDAAPGESWVLAPRSTPRRLPGEGRPRSG